MADLVRHQVDLNGLEKAFEPLALLFWKEFSFAFTSFIVFTCYFPIT